MKPFVNAALAVLVWAAATPVAAQQPAPPDEVVGRIIAVVGDSVILNVNLDELLVRYEADGGVLPPPGPELDQLRRQLLDDRIDELLFVQAALRDTTVAASVSDAEIMRRVQQELQQRQEAVGGPAAFEQALRASGLTLQDLREMLASQLRRSMLIQNYLTYVARDRRPPRTSEAEMRRFLAEQREQLGRRPATVTFQQVVIPPQPSQTALDEARALADTVLARLANREDFEQLARRFSDDPNTRDRGGDLGWFKRGDFVPQFERVVFDMMRPGDISPPILTSYGYHIIKLERVRGSERQARHILIRVEESAGDRERALQVADSLAAELRAGRGEMAALHRQYDPGEEFHLSEFMIERLPPPYNERLAGTETGQIVGPFELIHAEHGGSKWAIVRVLRYDDSGEWSLDNPMLREQVRERLEQAALHEEIIRELRSRTYVDIRLDRL